VPYKDYEKHKESARENYRRNRVKVIKQHRHTRDFRRKELMALLGQHECVTCGFNNYSALQFDHIGGGGSEDLLRFNGHHQMYKYYLAHPEEAKQKLQVLCANCNWIKRYKYREVSGYFQ
jgi:hypothetical protein